MCRRAGSLRSVVLFVVIICLCRRLSTVCDLVSCVINSLVFPGAWACLTSAAVGPCATGTPPDTVERQTRPSIRKTLTEFMTQDTRATSGALDGSHSYRPVVRSAGVPGSGGVAHRTPDDLPTARLPLAPLLAAALLAIWLIVEPRMPDLAAQVYRLGLFDHGGFAVWDEHWYGGHDLPGYSLLFPPLASLLGLRAVAVLAALASAALFERLAISVFGPSARWGAVWFALAAVGDVWIGRVTFALGVAFALGAVFALHRRQTLVAGVLAALCAAASPVAGVLLGLAGVTHALHARSLRSVLGLVLPAALIVAPLAVLFPEGGFEPYPFLSFAATVLVVLVFLLALPPAQPLLRLGGLVYLAACLLCLLIHTPMGSNIERYAVLLAGPLLLCALLANQDRESSPAHSPARLSVRRPFRSPARVLSAAGSAPAAAVALCAIAVWVVWGPVRETLAVAGNASTQASYYAPVKRFLTGLAAPVRIEVPLTRSHWEAALLAPSVSLARGWEKQLDDRYDRVLLTPGLTAAGYNRWLHEQAIAYVALPDTPLDPSSAQEGRLIRRGLPYLRAVFTSAHWRIYAVRAPTPLAAGPGALTALGHNSFALRASTPGSFLVRVHYTPYFVLTRGAGCVRQAPGGWTSVAARAPGALVVAARFSLSRAFAGGHASCTGPR
jgi:hypothetical protein